MRVIIAGTRHIESFGDGYQIVSDVIKESGFEITRIVSGTCRGVDKLGEQWASNNDIPIDRFFANWPKYGHRAGPIRNSKMANYADALIALPTIASAGTLDMIRKAKEAGLKIFIKEIKA